MARTSLASATSFVHLLGLRRPAAAEDDKDDKDGKKGKRAEDDDEEARARAAEDDDDDDKEKRGKRAEDDDDDKRAEDDTDGKRAEDDDDDDDDDDDGAEGKRRGRRAEDDDDDEGDPKASAIRLRERARCAAIFAHPAAAKRPDMAAHLAFGTSLSRRAAIDTLKAVAAGEPRMLRGVALRSTDRTRPSDAYRARMAQEPNYDVGSEREAPTMSSPEAFAKAVIAADKRRRGEA
jgi:hypothetical protein